MKGFEMKETETLDLRMSGCNYTIVSVTLCLGSGEMRTDRLGPTLKQAQADLGKGGGYGLCSREAKQACLLAGGVLTVFSEVKERHDSALGPECLRPQNSFSYTFIS